MKSPNTNLITRFASPQPEPQRRSTAAEREKLAHDLRTGIRAIAIYTDLMQRDIDADPDKMEMQQYCDGINATIQELTDRIELISVGAAIH